MIILSAIVALAAVYLKIKINSLQQGVVVLLIFLLILLNQILFRQKDVVFTSILHKLFLLATSLFVQFLVLSTGGLLSPFLILIHLFTIGASFLVGLIPAIIFLILSITVVTSNILLDQIWQRIFLEDIGASLLYLISFIVVIPLAMLVAQRYRLKEALLDIVSRELKLNQLRQKSVLSSISDLVFVTDKNLNILSVNEACEKALSMSGSELIHRSLFDVLFLKDKNDQLIKLKGLSVDRVLEEKTTRIIKDLLFISKNTLNPRRVNIQVRPIVDLEGRIDQITFVVSDSSQIYDAEARKHSNLEEARTKYQAMMENLKSSLLAKGLPGLRARAELIRRTQQDLLNALELEDHSIQSKLALVDVSQMCHKMVVMQQDFALTWHVPLEFVLVNFDMKDVAPLIPKGYKIAPTQLTSAYFTAPIDVVWLDLLLQELVSVAILLTSDTKHPKVSLTVERQDNKSLIVRVISNFVPLTKEEERMLLTEYYGSLSAKTNLSLGSGLEGYVAKTIAASLNTPLTIESTSQQVIFKLLISKGASPRY